MGSFMRRIVLYMRILRDVLSASLGFITHVLCEARMRSASMTVNVQ